MKQVTITELIEKYGFTHEELYGEPLDAEPDEVMAAIQLDNQSLWKQ